MIFQFIAAAASAAFTFIASNVGTVAQFIGSAILSYALSPDGPKLADLKLQVSAYGGPIPRLYGSRIRVAGNVIDKSDLIQIKHKTLGGLGPSYYSYYCHMAVLLSEGAMIQAGGLRRIFADGKVIFDRDQAGATAGTANFRGVTDAFGWTRNNFTMAHIGTVTLFPGTATQGVDPTLQALYPGDEYPAYRHTCYVVLERFDLADWGNRIPSLEFELEPVTTKLGDVVADMAALAGVDVYANRLTDTVRGYACASKASVWASIQPLAAIYAFDLIQNGAQFEAVKRGRYLRAVIPVGEMGARDVRDGVKSTKNVTMQDKNKIPDEVTITYVDIDRDYQTNSQSAARNQAISESKLAIEVPCYLTADEARGIAQRTLYEGLVGSRTIEFELSSQWRWLKTSDVIGLQLGDQVEPFRLTDTTRSPNGVIACEAVYEDPYLYPQNLTGSSGDGFPTQTVDLPGDTIIQPMDAALFRDANDDTGFNIAFAGTLSGWRGTTIYRAPGVGSPLTFELIGDYGPIPAVIGDCTTTLPSGPTDVWDEVSTLTATFPGEAPESATEADVLVLNKNLAWVGDPDGHDGEYINFRDATTGSPEGTYILSGLLRGRYGSEFAVGSHGSGERVVLITQSDRIERLNFGAADWNVARTYRGVSLPLEDGEEIEFTNTGEGKRPLSGVHLNGSRDGSNNLTVDWERRTRFQTGDVAAAVPLGEETEAYEVDIMSGSPLAAIRTIAATTPQISYTAAQQTADGLTPGNPVDVEVYQLSTIRGRGRPLSGTV